MKKKGRKVGPKSHSTAVVKTKKRKNADVVSAADPSLFRGAGKRHRRPFNPHSWNTSIPTTRQNILCLGMSYPCVESNIEKFGLRKDAVIENPEKGVDQAVELVRRGILTEMDGRDLARVLALEANNDMLAYTVSMEKGAIYGKRHLEANFNRTNFIKLMQKEWRLKVFRQVILDYFWIPAGSWAMEHWKTSFFRTILPSLVVGNMLNFGDIDKDSVLVPASEDNGSLDFISSSAAVVYLPFCSHCFREVVASYDVLSKYFTISFMRRDQLAEHSLWKATNTIAPNAMQHWLGKAINQEEVYCKIKLQEILHGGGNANVSNEELIKVFKRIDRREEVRMIKLTALRRYHPKFEKSKFSGLKTTVGVVKGGYVGLLGPDHVHQVATTTCPLPILAEEEPVLAVEIPEKKRRRRVSAENSVDENHGIPKIIMDEIVTTPSMKKARESRHRVSEDNVVDYESQTNLATCTKNRRGTKIAALHASAKIPLSDFFRKVWEKEIDKEEVHTPCPVEISHPVGSIHHKSQNPKKFPRLLRKILANEDEAVSWTPSGEAFVIKNDEQFFEEVFPRYFGNVKYKRSLFHKYLIRYGFDRVDDDQITFSHTLFRRDGLDNSNETIAVWQESSNKAANISGSVGSMWTKPKQVTRRSNAETEAVVVERIGNTDDCYYDGMKDETKARRHSLRHQTPDLKKNSPQERQTKSRYAHASRSSIISEISTTSTTGWNDLRQLSFQVKLWRMVGEESESVISWSKHGDSLVIKDVDCFSILLKKYLNPVKRISAYKYFQKNLKLTGFRQDKRRNDVTVYYHKYFTRNNHDVFIGATYAELRNAMINCTDFLPQLNDSGLSRDEPRKYDNLSKSEEFGNLSSEECMPTELNKSRALITAAQDSSENQESLTDENKKVVASQKKDKLETSSTENCNNSLCDIITDNSDGLILKEFRNKSKKRGFKLGLKNNPSHLRNRSRKSSIESTIVSKTSLKPLSFGSKLRRMIEKEDDSIICWSPQGDCFLIKNRDKFCGLLRHYFNTPRNRSMYKYFLQFLRQRGFRQVATESDKIIFYHKFFVRDNPGCFELPIRELKVAMDNNATCLPLKVGHQTQPDEQSQISTSKNLSGVNIKKVSRSENNEGKTVTASSGRNTLCLPGTETSATKTSPSRTSTITSQADNFLDSSRSGEESTDNIVAGKANSEETLLPRRNPRRSIKNEKINTKTNTKAVAMAGTSCNLLQLPFKMKLVNMLKFEPDICWSTHGDSIIIKDLDLFSTILDKYLIKAKGKTSLQHFRHSIERMGFRQDTRETEPFVYYHKHFIRHNLDNFFRFSWSQLKRAMENDAKYLPCEESTNSFTTTNHNQFSNQSSSNAISNTSPSPTNIIDSIHRANRLPLSGGEAISANVLDSLDESTVIGLQVRQSLLPFETQVHDSMDQCSTVTLTSDLEKLQFNDTLDVASNGNEGSVSKITVGEKDKQWNSNIESGSMQSKEISAPKLLGTDTPKRPENTATTTGDDYELNSGRKSNESVSSTTKCSELSHKSFMNCQSAQSSQVKGESHYSSTKDRFSASNVGEISTARNCFESPFLVTDGNGESDFKGSNYGNNGDSTAGDHASSASTQSGADSFTTKTMSLPEGSEEPIYCDDVLPLDGASETYSVAIRTNISEPPDKSVVIELQARPTPLTTKNQNHHLTGQCPTANVASDRDNPGGSDTSDIVSKVNEGSVCESTIVEKGGLSMNDHLEPDTEISAPVSSIGDRNEASSSTSFEVASKHDSNSGLNCRNDQEPLDLESECDDRTFDQWVRLTKNLLHSNPNNLHCMLEKLHSIQNDDSSVRMPQH